MKTVTKFKKSSIFIIIALLIMPALNSLQAAAAGQYVWTSNNQPSQFPVESRYWADLDYSDDGSIAYGVASGNIFKSIDSGVTWQRLNLLEGANISGVTVSADGTKIFAYGKSPNSTAGINGTTIFKSVDAGETWTIIYSVYNVYFNGITSSNDGTKVVTWESNGKIFTSDDSGANWVARDSAGSRQWWSVASNSTGSLLVAVVYSTTDQVSGNVYTSNDFGLTWTAQTTPNSSNWASVDSTSNGQYLVATTAGYSSPGYIYTSNDYGVTWTPNTVAGQRYWRNADISDNGQRIAAVAFVQSDNTAGNVYVSSDSGNTWTTPQTPSSKQWHRIELSSDGSKLIAAQSPGTLFNSNDSGLTWTKRITNGAQSWSGVASSSDASLLAAVARSDYIYTSSDGGSSWTARQSAGLRDWTDITSSADGKYLAASVMAGNIFTSSDWGETWVERSTGGFSRYWSTINSSSDGSTIIATAGSSNTYIYTSTDYGATWTGHAGPGTKFWYDSWVSDDGSKMIAITYTKDMAISYDSGATWDVKTTPYNNMYHIAASSDASSMFTVIAGYAFYKSTDLGVTWTYIGSAPSVVSDLVASSDGVNLAAADEGGSVSFSRNGGTSWTRSNPGGPGNKASIAVSDDFNKTAFVIQYASSIYTATYYSGPTAPRNLVVNADNTGEANISWQEPSSPGSAPITSYTLEYKKNTSSIWESIQDITGLSYALSGLEVGAGYDFRVMAVNDYINGDSASISISIPRPPLPPREPRLLDQPKSIQIGGSNNTPTISWEPVENKYGGVEWEQDTDAAPWDSRYGHTSTTFDNKIWVIGGRSGFVYKNDVWSSPDGINWTEETNSAPWSGRGWHGSVTFNNRIWVIGGSTASGVTNDVWSSPDGINWTEETNSAPWSARDGHQVAVFNNKIWVAGSWDYTNDVWSSSDGINWTEETNSAPWPGRAMFGMEAFDNKLWVLGGESDATDSYMIDDVWSSPDGVNWTREVEHAPWGERGYYQSAVYDGKLWVLGGYYGMDWDYADDVWSSSDGINWNLETDEPGWLAREEHTVAVLGNKMFIMGGYLSSYARGNDVWSTSSSVVSYYRVCWDTIQGGCSNTATSQLTTYSLNQALPPGTWYFSVTAINYQNEDSVLGASTSLVVPESASPAPSGEDEPVATVTPALAEDSVEIEEEEVITPVDNVDKTDEDEKQDPTDRQEDSTTIFILGAIAFAILSWFTYRFVKTHKNS